jgi:hypothetical protein
MTQLLTHSRQDSFKVCRKKHWFSYELGVRSANDGKALRMGSAYHDGIEALSNGLSVAQAVDVVRLSYEGCPQHFDAYGWEIECETVVRMICGYEWRWRNDGIRHVAAELEFNLPLLNPATGKSTPSFNLAGKIDGIVELADGRLAVKECKLLGDSIDRDADLWQRLRIDHQISMYVLAARRLGYPVDCVLYDVGRKPTIAPTAVALLDELGVKIVNDAQGNRVKTDRGMWRQTGDKDRGYVLQTRPMSIDEWGDKLNNDIAERPDFYYARNEIMRLDQDLDEYASDLWEMQKTIRDAQLNARWFRTVNKNTCSWCEFFGLCTTGFNIETDVLPEQFVRVENVNPELKGLNHVHDNAAESTAAATQATA